MVPLTSPIGAVHKSEQDFFLPSHIPELNNPSHWQQAGCPCGCHHERLGIVPARPSAAAVRAGSWHRESPAVFLYQKTPYPPFFVAAVPSQKLTLIPCKHICHSKSVSPWDVLLYCNNLFAFPQLSGRFYAAWVKILSTFPFQVLISLSEASCKNSPWERCFYCCCIFLSCHFIPNKTLVPPRATCSHLRPAFPSFFNYHFTYLLWLYAEPLTLENMLHVAVLSLRCWLDWLLSWPWGQDSTQRP